MEVFVLAIDIGNAQVGKIYFPSPLTGEGRVGVGSITPTLTPSLDRRGKEIQSPYEKSVTHVYVL